MEKKKKRSAGLIKVLMKKALRETQMLHTGCSKAEPKIFAPPQTLFLGAQEGQNLISWRWSLPSPTDPVWWRSMHAILSYRCNRPTNKHTHTKKQDRLQYTALLSLACSVMRSSQKSKWRQAITELFVWQRKYRCTAIFWEMMDFCMILLKVEWKLVS